MIARIQVRRDSSGNWTLNDPILALGEIGYETNTEKFKVGDGLSNWSNLNYELGQWKSDSSGNITYGAQAGEGDVFIQNSLVVTGNLTVNGTTTTINTEEVTIEDNMVLLNSNLAIAPPSTLESGIEVNLGTSGSTKLYWDQATLKWTVEGDLNVEGDIYSNNIALWRLNGNDIYFQGGDVGIGINNPNTTLHIKSTAPIITLEDESDPAWIWEVGQNSDKFFINTETVTDGSMFTILNNGRVGIGETEPDAPLHVDSSTGNLVAKFSSIDEDAYISFEDDGTTTPPLVGANDNDLLLWTNNQKRVTIKSDGKVGIGTIPLYELHVKKDQNARTNLVLQNFNTGTSADAQIFVETKDGAGDPQLQFQIDGEEAYTLGIDNSDSDKFKISDYGSLGTNDRLVIDSTGNVGIGTSAPSAKLTVNKGDDIGFIVQDNTTDNHRLHMMTSASDNGYYIGYASGQSEGYKLNSSGNSYFLGGNVGIGTNGPSGKLSLNDTTNNTSITLQSNNQSRWWITADGTTTTPYTNVLKIGGTGITESSEGIINIKSTGNVGIGIVNPTEKLEVNGAIKLGTTSSTNAGTIRWTGTDFQGYTGPTDGWQSLLTPSGLVSSQWTTGTGANSNDIYYNTGNVGIGTSTPSEKLSVVGNITATGTITSTSDISVKENIELISNPIEKVKELSGYTFNKKGEDVRLVGLIAQEVEKVIPEAVHENQEGVKSLAYGNMVALLVECIKKQDERIETLEKTIENLK